MTTKNEGGRMFVCGDIHGCYDELMTQLSILGFDFDTDILYGVGDLIDRGPKSLEVLMLLEEPWFDSVLGNHEQMAYVALNDGDRISFLYNGGSWTLGLQEHELFDIKRLIRPLKVAKTVTSPSGRKIGLVHAEVAFNDWDEFSDLVNNATHEDRLVNSALWGRERIRMAMNQPINIKRIKNVDHVYMGHTPVKEPLTIENMTWLDTGCFSTGKITVLEVN